MVLSSELIRLDNSFLARFNLFTDNVDLDEVHQFRKDFKKLKVLYALINSFDRSQMVFNNDWEERKSVFKCAGAVREAQINKQLIGLYLPDENNLISFFEDRLNILLDKFSNCISRYHLIPIGNFAIGSVEEELLVNGNINQYQQNISSSVKSLKVSNNQLHQIRAYAKALVYLQQLHGNLKGNQLNSSAIKTYKDIENDIGVWHDRVVLLSALSRLRKHLKLEYFYPAIKTLLNKHCSF